MTKHPEREFNEATAVTEFESPSELAKGEIYYGVVDRVPSNALVDMTRGEINLGPIDQAAEGETVRFEFVTDAWGKCLEEDYIYDGYEPRDGESSNNGHSARKTGKQRKETRKTKRIYSGGGSPFSGGSGGSNKLANNYDTDA